MRASRAASISTEASISSSNASDSGVIITFDAIARRLNNTDASTPEQLAISDLRLLHHYTTVTYATFDRVTSQHHIWQNYFIHLGFEHHYVLRGIFAVTALHLAILDPSSSASLMIQSSTQCKAAIPPETPSPLNPAIKLQIRNADAMVNIDDRGLAEFRTVLRDLKAENSSPVVAFSCLTVIHAFAIAQVTPKQEPITDLLNCLGLIRGVATVVRPYWYEVLETEMRPILDNGIRRVNHGHVAELSRLEELVESILPSVDPTMAADYLTALEELHNTISEVQNIMQYHSVLAVLFSWPVVLSERFMSCLAAHEPVSLIIIAHFAASFSSANNIWWLENWNKHIIIAVDQRLLPEFQRWLDWPKQICGLDTDSEGGAPTS